MKKIYAILMLVMVIFGFSGCDLWNSIFGTTLPGMAGKLLSVDGKKHFKEDIEYHQWSQVNIYRKDGTFEIDSFSDQSTTQILQDWGLRGTYAYDPDTLTMTMTATQEYNSGRAPGAWYIFTTTQTRTAVIQQYCADHEFGWVYRKNGSSWICTWVDEGTDSTQPLSGTWQYISTETYTLVAGIGGYNLNRTGVLRSGSNPAVTRAVVMKIGDAELFPAGAKFEKGESVTVHAKLTTNTIQSWDSINGLGAPVNDTLYYESRSFQCLGDSIIEFPSNASRDRDG